MGADRNGRPLTLNRVLDRHLKTFRGDVGLYVRHLRTDEAFAYHADRPFRTASVFKIAVLVEVFRQGEAGDLDLDDPGARDERGCPAGHRRASISGPRRGAEHSRSRRLDEGIRNDAGIVYSPGGPCLVVCFASGVPDEALACWKIARLSRAVFDYFSLPPMEPGRERSASTACVSQEWSLLVRQQWEDAADRFVWNLRSPGGAALRAWLFSASAPR
jgi:hypothetical protein